VGEAAMERLFDVLVLLDIAQCLTREDNRFSRKQKVLRSGFN